MQNNFFGAFLILGFGVETLDDFVRGLLVSDENGQKNEASSSLDYGGYRHLQYFRDFCSLPFLHTESIEIPDFVKPLELH